MINTEILDAIGLSFTFMGIIFSIIAFGVIFFIYKTTAKEKRAEIIRMVGLMTAWAIFIALNMFVSTSPNYKATYLVYSLAHLISIVIGLIVMITFFFFLPKLWKFFDKPLLIMAGTFALSGLILRVINPFIVNDYLSLIQRIFIIIPPLMGLFMIIKSKVRRE